MLFNFINKKFNLAYLVGCVFPQSPFSFIAQWFNIRFTV